MRGKRENDRNLYEGMFAHRAREILGSYLCASMLLGTLTFSKAWFG